MFSCLHWTIAFGETIKECRWLGFSRVASTPPKIRDNTKKWQCENVIQDKDADMDMNINEFSKSQLNIVQNGYGPHPV